MAAPGLFESGPLFANPQEILPLAKIATKAHAFGYLKARDNASLDLLASLWPGRLRRQGVL